MNIDTLTALHPRTIADITDLAVVVQANLVQLKVAESKRGGFSSILHDIRVRPPGAVLRFREHLIDRKTLGEYDAAELILRMHEVWGQYCMFCWYFYAGDPHQAAPFKALAERTHTHCPTSVAAKTLEIEKTLWRLRFEQRYRTDQQFRERPDFDKLQEAAAEIPAIAIDEEVHVCSDEKLLLAACEFAGMLASARWIGDDRWNWGQAGIMSLPTEPALQDS